MKVVLVIIAITVVGCSSKSLPDTDLKPDAHKDAHNSQSQDAPLEVLAVEVSGSTALQFSVTIRSPDTGCERYADWWEVVSSDESLIYRRVLAHSHPDEQPFTRAGGPVEISTTERVIVRAHMNDDGYSPFAMEGTVEEGFSKMELVPDFGTQLETSEPLPNGCAF